MKFTRRELEKILAVFKIASDSHANRPHHSRIRIRVSERTTVFSMLSSLGMSVYKLPRGSTEVFTGIYDIHQLSAYVSTIEDKNGEINIEKGSITLDGTDNTYTINPFLMKITSEEVFYELIDSQKAIQEERIVNFESVLMAKRYCGPSIPGFNLVGVYPGGKIVASDKRAAVVIASDNKVSSPVFLSEALIDVIDTCRPELEPRKKQDYVDIKKYLDREKKEFYYVEIAGFEFFSTLIPVGLTNPEVSHGHAYNHPYSVTVNAKLLGKVLERTMIAAIANNDSKIYLQVGSDGLIVENRNTKTGKSQDKIAIVHSDKQIEGKLLAINCNMLRKIVKGCESYIKNDVIKFFISDGAMSLIKIQPEDDTIIFITGLVK